MKLNLFSEETVLFGPFSLKVYAVNPKSSAFERYKMDYLDQVYKTLLIESDDARLVDAKNLLLFREGNTKTLLYILLEKSVTFIGEKTASKSQHQVPRMPLVQQQDISGIKKTCAQLSAYWKGKAEITVDCDTADTLLFTFTPH